MPTRRRPPAAGTIGDVPDPPDLPDSPDLSDEDATLTQYVPAWTPPPRPVNQPGVVHYERCWRCQTGRHHPYPRLHPWWGIDDVIHAKRTGRAPRGSCSCLRCGLPAHAALMTQPVHIRAALRAAGLTVHALAGTWRGLRAAAGAATSRLARLPADAAEWLDEADVDDWWH